MLCAVFLYAENYNAKAVISKDTAFVGDVLMLNLIINSDKTPDELSIASDDKWSVKQLSPFNKVADTENTYLATYQFVPIVDGDLTIASFLIKNADGDKFITNPLSVKTEVPEKSQDMIFLTDYSPKKVFIGQVVNIRYVWKSLHALNTIKSVNITIPNFDDENFESFTNANYIDSNHKSAIGLPVHNQRLVGRTEILRFDDTRRAFSVSFSTLAIPQNAGKFVFEAPYIVCAVPKNRDVSGGVPANLPATRFLYPAYFDNEFFNYQADASTLKKQFTKADDLAIEVLPLPIENMPENFSYIIGDYSISAKASNTSLRVGDTIEYVVTIEALNESSLFKVKLGEENFSAKGFDKFEFPKEFPYIIEGDKKIFKVKLLVRSIESTKIPALNFNFFNPNDEKYYNLKTQEIELKVAPSQSARILAEDGSEILIKTKLTKNTSGIYDAEVNENFFVEKKESFIGGLSLFKFCLISLTFPLIFLVIFAIKTLKKIFLNSTNFRNRLAFNLKLKSIALKSEVSVDEIEEIIIEVFSIYVDTEKKAMSFVDIKEFLQSRNCPENLIEALGKIFEKLRDTSYSKSKENNANKVLLKETVTLVKKINRNLK